MKRVLFLAPNYKYIQTTVRGVSKYLAQHKIDFTTTVPIHNLCPDTNNLYLRTNEVEVIFDYHDPVEWTGAMLAKIDAVFGKKELVDRCRERFWTTRAITYGKGSIDKFILMNSTINDDPTVCDDIPAKTQYIPEIANVYFNNPMTVVIWKDGTKTLVRCQSSDAYSEETGLALCISKKAFGNKGNFNDIFKKWIPNKEINVVEEET